MIPMVSFGRPPLRQSKGRSMWNCAGIAIAAISLALTVRRSCSAFTSGFSAPVTSKAQRQLQGLQWQAAVPANGPQEAGKPAGVVAWQCFGCAALVLAATMRNAQNSKVRKPRHAVTACLAAPVSVPAPVRAAFPPVATSQSHGCCEGLLIDTAPTVVHVPAPVCPPVVGASPATLVGLTAEVSAPASVRPRVASAGRFVGGARRSCRRAGSGRRATTQERTARRSFGAKLQSAQTIAEVVPASFDPSRLETRIQMGLRTSSRIRAARGREFKTPSVSKSSSDSTCVCWRGTHFEGKSRGVLCHQHE
mmetsp:Transcript_87480/g.255808  ORF Transcript_87480/g.255808 Transcript_87480/m.255808 type:complete len:307 (+) Transcript_87480:55-975(+)